MKKLAFAICTGAILALIHSTTPSFYAIPVAFAVGIAWAEFYDRWF